MSQNYGDSPHDYPHAVAMLFKVKSFVDECIAVGVHADVIENSDQNPAEQAQASGGQMFPCGEKMFWAGL